MLRRIDLRGGQHTAPDLASRLPRARLDVDAAIAVVRPVVDDVRSRGAEAVREATLRFDGLDVADPRVPADVLASALAALDPSVRAALEECARRVRVVSEAQRRAPVRVQVAPGATVTERYLPVDRVGLYVPGGRVAYPSSVVMNVVPAQVAGVGAIAIASPPTKDGGGWPHPVVLAACALLGITEVYAVGGAQAIAMLALGTEHCPAVDVITGPGNVYVAAAKRLVRGAVSVDAEAGPTEIAIVADRTAAPELVAADLVAQAEHDPLASCLLITDHEALCDAVDALLAVAAPTAHHSDAVTAAFADQSAHVLVDDVAAAIAVSDAWGPEHLEVLTADAAADAATVRHAGAVFVGAWTPVSLGDYLAGSNHVLPTGGTARHTAGLSVDSFVRGVHVVEYDRAALAAVSEHVASLGGAEVLPAHVEAVRIRGDLAGRLRDDLAGGEREQ